MFCNVDVRASLSMPILRHISCSEGNSSRSFVLTKLSRMIGSLGSSMMKRLNDMLCKGISFSSCANSAHVDCFSVVKLGVSLYGFLCRSLDKMLLSLYFSNVL